MPLQGNGYKEKICPLGSNLGLLLFFHRIKVVEQQGLGLITLGSRDSQRNDGVLADDQRAFLAVGFEIPQPPSLRATGCDVLGILLVPDGRSWKRKTGQKAGLEGPKHSAECSGAGCGAGDRNRTCDLRVTSALLYRLSYTGVMRNVPLPWPLRKPLFSNSYHAALRAPCSLRGRGPARGCWRSSSRCWRGSG